MSFFPYLTDARVALLLIYKQCALQLRSKDCLKALIMPEKFYFQKLNLSKINNKKEN